MVLQAILFLQFATWPGICVQEYPKRSFRIRAAALSVFLAREKMLRLMTLIALTARGRPGAIVAA